MDCTVCHGWGLVITPATRDHHWGVIICPRCKGKAVEPPEPPEDYRIAQAQRDNALPADTPARGETDWLYT